MKNIPLLLLCLVSNQLRHVVAYSSGAPGSACQSLTPAHGVEPQTSDPPFSIITTATSVNGTDPLEVVLRANQGKTFKGFILQARNAESHELLGVFNFQADGGLPSPIKYMDCDVGRQAAVTHTNNKPKQELTLTWESSGYYDGVVIFNGTFVESKETFWVGVMSQEVRVTASEELTTNMPTPSTTLTTTMPISSTTPKSGATSLLQNNGVNFLISMMTTLIFSNQISLHFN